ncbi:hypothetical protein Tsubulata_041544 [Turnera subulata]|uniref:Uncharacterized protein n=1 Tax=Turnera subulata TaxID=218843 RepID=A0A9Q0FQQ7_9ROSI|nr:hypothetical protein Tsubulata_041544 [Turnera subulata]
MASSYSFGISATLAVLYLFSLVFLSVPHLSLCQQPDIHDLLPRMFGLPPGLIPNNVDSYHIPDTGAGPFSIQLSRPCSVRDPFPVEYAPEIRGIIRYHAVSGLMGVFVPIPNGDFVRLTDINVSDDGERIVFYAWGTSQTLPAQIFQQVPACEDGEAAALQSAV